MTETAKQSEQVYLTCQSRYWHIVVRDGDVVETHGRVGSQDVKSKKSKYESQVLAMRECDRLVMKMKRKGFAVGEKPTDSIDADCAAVVKPTDSTDVDQPAKKRARTEADGDRTVKLTTEGGQKLGMRLVAANERKETGLRIKEIVPGGQAAKTGSVFANDLVTHVNGMDVQQMSLGKAKKLMMSADTFRLTLFRHKEGHRSEHQASSASGPATCKTCKREVSLLPKVPFSKWRCDSCGVDGFSKSDKMFACTTLKKCDYGICVACFEKSGSAGTSDTKTKQSTKSKGCGHGFWGREERFCVTASHILVKSETVCNKLKAALDSGADFEELAKRNSACPSGKKGGSLGTFGRGKMVPAFDKVIFDPATEIGAVSNCVETEFGFHLIKVSARNLNDKRDEE